jgi:hypothetical protein
VAIEVAVQIEREPGVDDVAPTKSVLFSMLPGRRSGEWHPFPCPHPSIRHAPRFHQPEEIAMTKETSPASRRRFFKITAVGLAAAPFANALLSGVAQAVDMVKETDPTAAALGYVMDAAKSAKRTDKAAACSNCSLFSGKPGAPDGPCTIFQGNLVSAKGWCTAWVKKA